MDFYRLKRAGRINSSPMARGWNEHFPAGNRDADSSTQKRNTEGRLEAIGGGSGTRTRNLGNETRTSGTIARTRASPRNKSRPGSKNGPSATLPPAPARRSTTTSPGAWTSGTTSFKRTSTEWKKSDLHPNFIFNKLHFNILKLFLPGTLEKNHHVLNSFLLS